MPLPPPPGTADYGQRAGHGPRVSTLPSGPPSPSTSSPTPRRNGPSTPTSHDHAAANSMTRDHSRPSGLEVIHKSVASPDRKDTGGRKPDANGHAHDRRPTSVSKEIRDFDRTDASSTHRSIVQAPTYRNAPSASVAVNPASAGAANAQPSPLTQQLLAGPSTETTRPPGSSAPGTSRQPCAKCGQPMTGQFVRALGMVYHLDCFRCQDCGKVVASKFFPVDGVDGKQYPLCETDYFKRLGLICAKCGGALRGSYITALDMKFHVEHFTCSVCPTVFGPQDSYYEHDGRVFCHFHYSTRFAVKCTGCRTAILKQFVEINRNSTDEHWHPECYMIHKFWNIKLAPSPTPAPKPPSEPDVGPMPGELAVEASGTPPERSSPAGDEEWKQQEVAETPQSLKDKQKLMEEQVYRIWTVLSTFEESSAACISEMLRHVSNGQYLEGVRMAEKFVLHVETLFAAIDDLGAFFRQRSAKEISHVREARMLCKKIVNFFSLLSHTHETGARKMNVTQELLSLVTGLAHYLKILIRIALASALKLDRDYGDRSGIGQFLGRLDRLARDPEASKGVAVKQASTATTPTGTGPAPAAKPRAYGYKSLSRAVGTLVGQGEATTDLCEVCRLTVEEECVRFGTSVRWHCQCLQCQSCGARPTRERPRADDDAKSPTRPLRGFKAEMSQPREGRSKPQKVFCGECASSTAQDGFEFVTRLEQYAFLLCVALNKLYGLLKQRGVLSLREQPSDLFADARAGEAEAPGSADERPAAKADDNRSLYDAYRNSTDIKRMKSVDLDRKLSTTARLPQRSTVVESPAGRVAQQSDAPKPTEAAASLDKKTKPAPPKEVIRPPERPRPPREAPPAFARERDAAAAAAAANSSRSNLLSPSDPSVRPTLSRNTTAVRIVNEQPPDGQARDDARLGDQQSPIRDEGITLADLPRAMEAEQLREQHRPLPSQTTMLGELSALESVIVKHVAALSLANSAIKDETTLDELLEIVETRKGNFWGKLFKGGNEKNKIKKKGVFGVPLDVLIERHGIDSLLGAGAGHLRVPTFLDDCISAMKQMDMSVEGVFRKNGNIRRLKDLSDAVDRDEGGVNLAEDNPVQLAALLKKFLRDLPDPLLTFKLHHLFIATQRVNDDNARLRALHHVCCLLPRAHRDSMEVLFVFIKWVASFSHVDEETGSKMDLQNLATVLTPNILYARSKDPSRDESFLAIRAVHELLEHQDELFQVPADITAIMQDQELLLSNPNDLSSKDILRRVEVLMRQNAQRGGGAPARPTEQYRGRGEVHPHRPDVHGSFAQDDAVPLQAQTAPAQQNGMPTTLASSPPHGSPRAVFSALPTARPGWEGRPPVPVRQGTE